MIRVYRVWAKTIQYLPFRVELDDEKYSDISDHPRLANLAVSYRVPTPPLDYSANVRPMQFVSESQDSWEVEVIDPELEPRTYIVFPKSEADELRDVIRLSIQELDSLRNLGDDDRSYEWALNEMSDEVNTRFARAIGRLRELVK